LLLFFLGLTCFHHPTHHSHHYWNLDDILPYSSMAIANFAISTKVLHGIPIFAIFTLVLNPSLNFFPIYISLGHCGIIAHTSRNLS
jgi:hypothetical protein